MELRHLRYFVAVAESGSITKAALRLGIQQPPLGQQIRALEAELKVQLFERAPKRVVLSNAGKEFLNDARQILQSAKEAMEKVRRFDRGEQGLLTVGFTSSASMHPIAPRILGAFNGAYPLAKVEVEERETYELILRLQQRELDAGFMRFAPRDLPGLTSTTLVDEEMVVAIPRGHALDRDDFGSNRSKIINAIDFHTLEHDVVRKPLRTFRHHALARKPQQPVTLKMLNGEGFVLYRRPDGVGIYDWLMASLAKRGFTPRVTHEVHRMMASINLVAAGAGLSLVPASMQTLHQEAVVYRPLAANTLPRLPLFLVHRTDQDLMLVKNFVKVAMNVQPKAGRRQNQPATR